jgi:ribosomal protein L13
MDMGDHVIVINARKAVLKGSKVDQKMYRHHTLYPGGLREVSAKDMLEKNPERVIELAVRECCPRINWARRWGRNSKFIPMPNTRTRPSARNPARSNLVQIKQSKLSKARGQYSCG